MPSYQVFLEECALDFELENKEIEAESAEAARALLAQQSDFDVPLAKLEWNPAEELWVCEGEDYRVIIVKQEQELSE